MEHQYEVIVGNIGTVYGGANEPEAYSTYETYVGLSTLGAGRASGEEVALFCDSELIKEYAPPAQTLLSRRRRVLASRFWELMEPTPEARGKMIDRLLQYVSTKELAEIVKEMEK
jgi:hypothetical protein